MAQDGKMVNLFAKVVLRREAQALQKAASFEEFKRILLRANTKSSIPKNPTLLEDVIDSPEVGGGIIYKPRAKKPLLSPWKEANGKRIISKRSLDVNRGEEAKGAQRLPNVNSFEDTLNEDENEDRESE